jgi:branched-chain amino acid transport system substrate-binding protein
VIITTSLDRDSTDPLAQAFIQGFQKKSGYPADMVSASTHTAVLVLAEAMKQVDPSDKAALRQAIASTSINAATGNISFNKLGEVRKSVQVQVVRDGSWHHFAVISDPVLLAPPEE